MRETVSINELVAGDTIDFEIESGFGIAVVTKVEDTLVHVERTYAHIGDIETTAGVGVTYGVERFTIDRRNSAAPIVRVNRSIVGQHWAAVTKERDAFKAEIARLGALVADQAKGLHEEQKQLDYARGTIKAQERQIAAREESIARQQAQTKTLTQERDTAREDAAYLDQKLIEAKRYADGLLVAADQNAERANAAERQVAELVKVLDVSREMVADREQQVERQSEAIRLLAHQAAKVDAEGRERAAELGAEVGRLQDKLTEAVEDLRSLTDTLDSKQTTIRTMRERIYELSDAAVSSALKGAK